MLYYTIGQWRIFVTMALCGLFAGAWYGVISRSARFLRAGVWLNAFCDVLIALGVWLCILVGLLVSNYGEVRLYALGAAALGFAIYRLTLARLLSALVTLIVRILRKTVELLGNCGIIQKIIK